MGMLEGCKPDLKHNTTQNRLSTTLRPPLTNYQGNSYIRLV